MIELVLKISKSIKLSEEYDKLLDKSNEEYNSFTMLIPEDKLPEVEELINHYVNKKTN